MIGILPIFETEIQAKEFSKQVAKRMGVKDTYFFGWLKNHVHGRWGIVLIGDTGDLGSEHLTQAISLQDAKRYGWFGQTCRSYEQEEQNCHKKELI